MSTATPSTGRFARRAVRHGVMLVALGVVMTLGVAWSGGLLLDPMSGHFEGYRQQSADPKIAWHFAFHRHPAGAARASLFPARTGRAHADTTTLPLPVPPPGFPVWGNTWPVRDPHFWTQGAFGWPCLAMWCRYRIDGAAAGGRIDATSRGGRMAAYARRGRAVAISPARIGTHMHVRVLPLGILWSGFALNVLFYAGVFELIHAARLGLLALVRRLRARHGRCHKCGYVLAGRPRCPECGAPVMAAGA